VANTADQGVRLNEMIGKPIISTDTGERGGSIEDVLLDGSHKHVVGVLLASGMLSRQRVLPFEDVQTVGVDTLIVKTLSTVRDGKDWLHEGYPAHRWTAIRGKRVVTADGAGIGTLRDLVADVHTGDVVAFEVASGSRRARTAQPAVVHDAGDVQLTNDIVVIPRAVAAIRPR
jgi:uncharacterized protein YrrD